MNFRTSLSKQVKTSYSNIESANHPIFLKRARQSCLAHEFVTHQNYSDRRKLIRFCWSVKLSAAAALSEAFASEPLLPWALTAVIRLLVRPSCRKKIRCPRPHNGAERN